MPQLGKICIQEVPKLFNLLLSSFLRTFLIGGQKLSNFTDGNLVTIVVLVLFIDIEIFIDPC